MFGYVVPIKSELKVRELAQYNAYYCGLCKTIGARFGEPARLTLNYDSTFFALLLTGIAGTNAEQCIMRRCGYKPFHKKRLFAPESEAIRFAADVNVLLAWYKLRDDWQDEKKILALGGASVLKAAVKRASAVRPNVMQAIDKGINELSALERSKCDILDAPADCFARMMRAAFEDAPIGDVRTRPALSALAYNIGKWVYLADAWEDRAQDAHKGSYNVFNLCNAGEERAKFLMHYSLNEAIKAYELLDVAENKEILDNIIYEGCTLKTQMLFGGKYE